MFESRQQERVPFFCDVAMSRLPGGPSIPARSLDLSLHGVGLVTAGSFEQDQLVMLSFSLRDAAQHEIRERVLGRIAYMRADVDANRVGVQFAEPLQRSKNPELVSRLLKI